MIQVSRCGMIYMEPSTLGWRPLVKSWLNEMPTSLTELYKSTINDLFERFCDACIQLVRKGGVKELAPTTDTQVIKGLMNLMDVQMDEFKDDAKISQMEEREIMTWLEVMLRHLTFIADNFYHFGTYLLCLDIGIEQKMVKGHDNIIHV